MVATGPEKIRGSRFTDYHCHLIPGLDDGPSDIQEAVEMAQILASFGFSGVVCTPHLVKGAYDNKPELIQTAISELRETLYSSVISLTLHASIEYYLDEYLLSSLDDPLCIGENFILVEAHRSVQPSFLGDLVYQIITRKRLLPLIAHPERYDLVDAALSQARQGGFLKSFWHWKQGSKAQSDQQPALYPSAEADFLSTLQEMGCLFQGNIGSFAGIYGDQVRKRAIRLLKMGFYDCLGTDAHKPKGLAGWLNDGMKIIRQEIGHAELARLLRPLESRFCL